MIELKEQHKHVHSCSPSCSLKQGELQPNITTHDTNRHCRVLFHTFVETAAYGLAHTTPEEFTIGGFTLKTYRMFSAHTTPGEFKMQQSPVILDLCLRKTRFGKLYGDWDGIVFKNLRFEMFSVHSKKTSRRLQISAV